MAAEKLVFRQTDCLYFGTTGFCYFCRYVFKQRLSYIIGCFLISFLSPNVFLFFYNTIRRQILVKVTFWHGKKHTEIISSFLTALWSLHI